MFLPSADFAAPLEVPADATLDARWHKWIRHETCRRSAWFVYILDTIACLEASIPSLVSPSDLSHLPLPACESMWSAMSDVEWFAFATTDGYQTEGITLDVAMQSVFGYDNAAMEGRPDPITGLKLGPFARTIIVMTLLRGLIEFGQGKPKGGVVTQTWITNGLLALKGIPVSQNWVVATYMRALAKVRPSGFRLHKRKFILPTVAFRMGPRPSLHAAHRPANYFPLSIKSRIFRFTSSE